MPSRRNATAPPLTVDMAVAKSPWLQSSDLDEVTREEVMTVFRQLWRCFPHDEDSIADCLKRELDARFRPYWQVVIGCNYSTYCTYEEFTFGCFRFDKFTVTIFKGSV